MGGILDRIWSVLVPAVGLVIVIAIGLTIAGLYNGPTQPQTTQPKTSQPNTVKAQRSPAIEKPGDSVPAKAPESAASPQPPVSPEGADPVRSPASPTTVAAPTPADQRRALMVSLKAESPDILSSLFDEKAGRFLISVDAKGGHFQPDIDSDMQLNARRIVRRTSLGDHLQRGIKSLVVVYQFGNNKPAIAVEWSAEVIRAISWPDITFAGLIDVGRLVYLSKSGSDPVRGYCTGAGSGSAPFCKSAYRHKLLR
jgi:hypothetical protein